METTKLFDLSHTLAADLLHKCRYPWQALPKIKEYTEELIEKLKDDDNYYIYTDGVLVSKNTVISKNATICAPAIIGHGSEIRTGAFIRGSVIIGEGVVVGNSCEIKNSILFDRVQVPHFNYVGDSILGYRAHTGAGVITSNVKCDRSHVTIKGERVIIETGLKKFGAMIGDLCEIGCNSVLNPGTIIGRGTTVYPLSSVRGVIPEGCIYKADDNIVQKNVR